MIFTEQFIFHSVPKTGTSSVQHLMLDNSLFATRNRFEVNGLTFMTAEHPFRGLFDTLNKVLPGVPVVAVFRSDFSRLRSAYIFYRWGRASKDYFKLSPLSRANVRLAKLLPFALWCLIVGVIPNKFYFNSSINVVAYNKASLLNDIQGLINSLTNLDYDFSVDLRLNSAEFSPEADYRYGFKYHSIFKMFVCNILKI
jgi:hypothetical protein